MFRCEIYFEGRTKRIDYNVGNERNRKRRGKLQSLVVTTYLSKNV